MEETHQRWIQNVHKQVMYYDWEQSYLDTEYPNIVGRENQIDQEAKVHTEWLLEDTVCIADQLDESRDLVDFCS